MPNAYQRLLARSFFARQSLSLRAATGEFDNMCVEGLALGQDIRTNCSVNTVFKGKTYCFGNDQAKEVFLKNPEGNLAKAETYYASKRR
jgi:YHS domain-containing protein